MRLAFSESSTGNPALSASNPALPAILAAVQRAWVASALAGAAASHSSAHAERAHAPSLSRFWTVAQFVQIRVISTAFKAYAFIPRLPLAREDAERARVGSTVIRTARA